MSLATIVYIFKPEEITPEIIKTHFPDCCFSITKKGNETKLNITIASTTDNWYLFPNDRLVLYPNGSIAVLDETLINQSFRLCESNKSESPNKQQTKEVNDNSKAAEDIFPPK
jgi:hypothetical protein